MIIYKYDLRMDVVKPDGTIDIDMPKDALVLSVQVQRGIPRIWALVDPKQPREWKKFKVMVTGFDTDLENYRFVGTFQLYDGDFIGHLFVLEERQ